MKHRSLIRCGALLIILGFIFSPYGIINGLGINSLNSSIDEDQKYIEDNKPTEKSKPTGTKVDSERNSNSNVKPQAHMSYLELIARQENINPALLGNEVDKKFQNKLTGYDDLVYVNEEKYRAIIHVDEITDTVLSELEYSGFELINTITELSIVVGMLPLETYDFRLDNDLLSGLITGIDFIEPDYIVEATYTPDDPEYTNQYSLINLEVNKAWDETFGNQSIKVAIIDTGIDYTHPDLIDNYVTIGYDHVNLDSDPMDDNGHGTHVAGTVAAGIDNAIGIAGVANVTIFAEKILDADGFGFSSDSAAGITHAVDAGANILSNSWGSSSSSSSVQSAVRYALDNNVTVIAAAGNDATAAKHYPAAYDGVIAVGSTDETNDLSYFSNFGDWVDVVAPGSNILSTQLGGGYHVLSGTSMATPHVSGVAALILTKFPNYTPLMVEILLKASATDLGSVGPDLTYGFGLVNASGVLDGLEENDTRAILNSEGFFPNGFVSTITYGVSNFGTYTQTNVIISLYINEVLVDQQTVSKLNITNTVTFDYNYTSNSLGSNNITVFVDPVLNENKIYDNRFSQFIDTINPRYNYSEGAFLGYLATFLNPYLLGIQFENMIDSRYQNVTSTFALALGVGFVSTNGTFDVYSGNLYDPDGDLTEMGYTIYDGNYQAGDKVDISIYGDQAGTVISTDAIRSYQGNSFSSYEIAYNGYSYYYHKGTGILNGVENSTVLDVQVTNILGNTPSFTSISVDMEVISNSTGEPMSYLGYVMNRGTDTESVDIIIQENDVNIYQETVSLKPLEIYPIAEELTGLQIAALQIEQTITLYAQPLPGEWKTSDNQISKTFTGDLHEYFQASKLYTWEDMSSATQFIPGDELDYEVDLPFEVEFYDYKSSHIMIDSQGGLSFSRTDIFIFYYSGDYPTFGIDLNYFTFAYLLDSSEYDLMMYKEFGDRVVVQYELTNQFLSQIVIHSDGTIDYNYKVLTNLPAGNIGMNHGGGIYGKSLDGLSLNIGNESLTFLYTIVNPELEVYLEPQSEIFGSGLDYQIDAKIINYGSTTATNVNYYLYENNSVILSNTISVQNNQEIDLLIDYTPSSTGLVNLTLIVDSVVGELSLLNNNITEFYNIVPASQILGFARVYVDDYSSGLDLPGIDLELWKEGILIDTGTTDVLGFYNFTSLMPGDYTVMTSTSLYYNRSSSFTIYSIGGWSMVNLDIEAVKPHWIEVLSESDSYTIDSTYHIELNVSYWDRIDFINVYVDGEFRIQVYYPIFDIPLLQNGTHDIEVEVQWFYEHSLNSTFQITDDTLQPIIELNVGDYFNYRLFENEYGFIKTGWFNFSVDLQIDAYTFNISFVYVYYDSNGDLVSLVEGYVVVSTLNAYVLESNTTWEYTKLYILSPLAAGYDIGTTFNDFTWDYYGVVNGSRIEDNYAVTTFATISMESGLDYWYEGRSYLNETGIMYSYNIDYYWYGDTYTYDMVLVDSNQMPLPETPIISGEENKVANVGTSEAVLEWTILDNEAISYVILENGTQVASGSEVTVSYDASGYAIGYYNFTIVVTDASANEEVFVTIIHITVTPPSIIGILPFGDQEYGSTGTVGWNLNGIYPDTYILYLNGSNVLDGAWTANQLVSYDFSNLQPGYYNFTIVVFNTYGRGNSMMYILHIVDTTAPVITSTSYDVTYVEGETGNEVTITISELSSFSYVVMEGENQLDFVDNLNGDISFLLPLDGFTPGTYTVQVIVVDEYGNIATISITVIVAEDGTNPPPTSNPPSNPPTTTTTPPSSTPTPPSTPSESESSQPPSNNDDGPILNLTFIIFLLSIVTFIHRKERIKSVK